MQGWIVLSLFRKGGKYAAQHLPRSGILLWVKRSGLAVLDQGFFSGANFLVNILLARWLSPEEYGAFAVALSVFYLLAGFHTAVLTEPMMVFGSGKYREQFRKYLGMLLYGHWGISAIIALVLGIVAFVFARYGSPAMARALMGLSLASPFLLLIWLVRRACYVPIQPIWAMVGSAVNLVVTLVGLSLLWRAGLLSPLSGLVLLGVAAAIASLLLMFMRLRLPIWGFEGNLTPAMVLADHWEYGKWAMLESVVYSASAQLWLVLVPVILGLTASGALAAIWNLYRPVGLFIQALGLTLLPTFANWVCQGISYGKFQKRTLGLATVIASATGLYGFFLTMIAKPLLHWLYSGKYDQYWALVPLSGWATVAAVLAQIFIIAMKAQRAFVRILLIQSVSALTILVISIPLMILTGVLGVVLGYSLGHILAAWLAFRMLRAVSRPA